MQNRAIDPYRDWLGVQDSHRPVGLYELLRLPPLERDDQRIAKAAESALQAIGRHRAGAPPELWHAVKAEVERAARTLVDPQAKAAYDAQVRANGKGNGNGNGHSHPAAGGKGVPAATLAAMNASHGSPPPSMNLAALAGMITCRECSRPSPQDRKFCPGCGHSLWEACVRCGTLCSADEQFCGSCGSNLRGALEEETSKVQAQIDEALEHFKVGKYSEAQRILRTLAKLENKRLAPLVQEAARLSEQLQQEWKSRESSSSQQQAEAQEAFDACLWIRAIEILESVPAALRNEAMEHLLREARLRRQEVSTLTREVQVGLATQRHLEILPKAQRLLSLDPTNEKLQQVIIKIGQKLLKTAVERLKTCKYDEAMQLLDQTPDAARDEQFQKVYEHGTEVTFLSTALRQWPTCDKTLVTMAERLLKLSPADETAKRLLQRMQQTLAAQGKKERALVPAAWARPPENTPFNCPVEAHYGFVRLKGRDADTLLRDSFVQHSAQFHVAAGLALQGLNKVRVSLNLCGGDEDEGFLSSLGGFLNMGIATTTAWGLDLTSHALKAVKLSIDKERGDAIVVDLVELIRPPLDLPRPNNEAELRAYKQNLVREFLARHMPREGERICVSMPGAKILGRFFDLPPIPRDKVTDAVRYESTHQIPIPLEQLAWGHYVLGKPVQEGDVDEPYRILLVAAKRPHVNEHIDLFESCGLKVHVLQSDCVALHNYVVYDLLEEEEFENDAGMLFVDLGSEGTNFVVSTLDDVWFRTVNAGAHEITQSFIRTFRLTLDQAEQLKRNPAAVKRVSKAFELFEPVFQEITAELHRSVDASPIQPIRHIYGVGGGFQTPGLLRRLRTKG